MALVGGFSGLPATALRPRRWGSSTVAIATVAGLAWIGLAAVSRAASPSPPGAFSSGASSSIWWCMPGMGLADSHASNALTAALAGLPMWALMSLAMTLPAAIPAVRHVAANSLRRRRRQAVSEFLAVFLTLWLAFGLLALTCLALLPSASRELALAAGLALAAVWELTPYKRRALNRCHRSAALPPHGWRARVGVARFGFIHGTACVASCWAAMLAMLAAPTNQLAWSAPLSALMASGKLARKPRRAVRHAAILLGTAAAGVVLALWITPAVPRG